MAIFGCPPELEQYRVTLKGEAGEFAGGPQNGLLMVKDKGLTIVFTNNLDDGDWEHVTVTARGHGLIATSIASDKVRINSNGTSSSSNWIRACISTYLLLLGDG